MLQIVWLSRIGTGEIIVSVLEHSADHHSSESGIMCWLGWSRRLRVTQSSVVIGGPLQSGGVWRTGCLRRLLRSETLVTGPFLSLYSMTGSFVTVAYMEGGEKCSTR